MHNIRSSLTPAEIEKELLKYKSQIAKLYKEGCDLGELCKTFRLDEHSILFLLKKSKIKKKKLYVVFENQNERIESHPRVINDKEKKLVDKFFPLLDSKGVAGGYYWHWREKYKKAQEKKEKCKHKVRNIRCSKCNKILRDASNIPIDNAIDVKKTNNKICLE